MTSNNPILTSSPLLPRKKTTYPLKKKKEREKEKGETRKKISPHDFSSNRGHNSAAREASLATALNSSPLPPTHDRSSRAVNPARVPLRRLRLGVKRKLDRTWTSREGGGDLCPEAHKFTGKPVGLVCAVTCRRVVSILTTTS